MRRVLSSEEMRLCDEITIKKHGVPGLLLMENAGRGVVEVIKQKFPSLNKKHILIICGKGNNGGDGFVIARLLSNSVKQVNVLFLASQTELKGDAKINFEILKGYARKSAGKIIVKRYTKKEIEKLTSIDLIIDSIFGTGFSGKVKKPIVEVINWINCQQAPVVSVDIPSGVNATTGAVENCAVKANLTVTFGNLKSGLLCNQGKINSGDLHIIDIGIPHIVFEDKRFQTYVIEPSDIRNRLPKRSVFAHKYSVGKVFVLAGSKGLTGAAAMCCASAMRAGAGAVILGTPESTYNILAKKLTETMVSPLPETNDGTLSISAFDKIKEKFYWADVLVVGPGLSQNYETQKLILRIISDFQGKLLIDADGLNAIAAFGVKKFRSSNSEFILTPHVGEFSRLTNLASTEIEQRRISVVKDWAKKLGLTIVLKGVPTVTTSRYGKTIINPTGNPGMATAGAGDVLSGIISSLWAQGMTGIEAAWAGVYLHGLSGDIAAKKIGEKSLVANDLIDFLPHAFQKVKTGVID